LVRRLEAGEPAARWHALGTAVRTAQKWRARYRAEGQPGLQGRSSRPRRSPEQTLAVIAPSIKLRMQRWTCAHIARPTA
jgi:transposase